jgi:hypothetical protein
MKPIPSLKSCIRFAAVFVLATLLAACMGVGIPPDKTAYVGRWVGKDITLEISSGGEVDYKRIGGEKGRVSVKAPIVEWEGNNFRVGLGPFNTLFVVSRPPFNDNGIWKMVVDGVELIKGGDVTTRTGGIDV